jgi:hypothetical protein
MATHEHVKYRIDPDWNDEYRHLQYHHETFNDPELLSKWRSIGYNGPFTGDMCDMRGAQPSWNQYIIDWFTKRGWQDIGTSYYRMATNTILPLHSDLYKRYVEIFNLRGKEETIRRAIVFLEPWKSGHYLEVNGEVIPSWSAGTVVEWTYDTPHMAANLGLDMRYTLQVTGHK